MIMLKTQREFFNRTFHFLCTEICRALLSNVSILYLLRNCCNALVTVSFATANNLQTLLSVDSSTYISVLENG